ncbi:MAG: hypothetical protein ACK5MQ_06165 [Pikeienuella sp.]
MLREPLGERELLIVGKTYDTKVKGHSIAHFDSAGAPFAARLTVADGMLTTRVAIEARAPIVRPISVLSVGSTTQNYVGLQDARRAEIVSTEAGEALLFPATFNKSAYKAATKNCLRKSTGCRNPDFRRELLVGMMSMQVAKKLRAGGIIEGYPLIEKAVGDRHITAELISIDSFTIEDVDRWEENGSITSGPSAPAAARAAIPELIEYSLTETKKRDERVAIYGKVKAMLRPVAPDFLLDNECGRVPGDSAIDLVVTGGTEAEMVRRARNYPGCAERVRRKLDPDAYARVFAEVQELAKQYQAIGGAVQNVEGGPGVQIKRLPMPHPDAMEMPVDRNLAMLAGRDYSRFERNVAEERARERRRREREQEKKMEAIRAAQALNEINGRIARERALKAGIVLRTTATRSSSSSSGGGSVNRSNRNAAKSVEPAPAADQTLYVAMNANRVNAQCDPYSVMEGGRWAQCERIDFDTELYEVKHARCNNDLPAEVDRVSRFQIVRVSGLTEVERDRLLALSGGDRPPYAVDAASSLSALNAAYAWYEGRFRMAPPDMQRYFQHVMDMTGPLRSAGCSSYRIDGTLYSL